MKILYVEDEISHVELAQRTLEDNIKGKFVLLHCDSYQGALDLIKGDLEIDVVLSDLRLPDGSGMDLLKRIQEMPRPPAVVLVTGQGDEQVAVAALKAGAADYLVKQSDYLHRLPVVLTNAVAQNNLIREKAAKLEAEIKYQNLIEQTPAVVFLDEADENETTIYINPRVEELTGYTPDEWRADPLIWEKGIHPDDKDHVLEQEKRKHSQGDRFQEEYRFIRRDGRIVWIKDDTNLIRDQKGNPLYWQGILIDITKEKENEDALQRQLKELTILNAVTAAGTEGLSEDEIIERFVKISSIIYNEVCGVLLLNEQGDVLTPHPSYYGANVSNWQNGTPITQGITGRCVLDDTAIRLGDITTDPAFIEIASGIRSELCVPIRVSKKIIGVYNVESNKSNAFDNEDEQFLTTVAGSLGTALERLRLFRQEQQRAKELDALYQATKTLALNLSPNAIAKSLLEIMDNLLGYDYASIYLLDTQENLLMPLAIHPKSPNLEIENKDLNTLYSEKRSLGQGIIGWVAQNGQAIRSGDVSKEERYLPVIKNIKSELCVPITIRDNVIGAVNVETTYANAYSERDETLLKALANSAAIALENARLYQDALRASERRAVLHGISQDIVRFAQDIEQVYKTIHDAAEKLMPCDVFLITIRNEATGENNYVYTMERGKRYSLGNDTSRKGLPQKVVSTGKSIILQNIKAIEDGEFPRFGSPTHVHSVVAVPMHIGEKITGVISAQSYKPNSYGTEEQSLLEMLATHAATAIENARLFQEESRRTQIIETLVDIANEIAIKQDIIPILDKVTERTMELLGANHVAIYLLHDENDILRVISAQGVHKKELLSHSQKIGEGITGSVVAKGIPEIIEVVADDHRRKPVSGTPESDAQHETMMSSPMILNGKPIGALNAWRRLSDGTFTQVELNFLTSIANQLSIAIESSNLFKQIVRRAQESAAIAEVGRDITATLQLDIVLNRIASYAMELLGAESSAVYLADPGKSTLKAIVALGLEAEHIINDPLEMGTGILGNIAMKMAGEIVNNTMSDPRSIIIQGTDMMADENIMGIPVLEKDQLTGLVAVWRTGADRKFSSSELDFLGNLAQQASTAIKNARLYDEVQRRLKEMETINRLSSSLRGSQEQTGMCNILLEETLNLLEAESGSVWIYDSTANMLFQRAARGAARNVKHLSLRSAEGIAGYVFSRGEFYISHDLKNDPVLFDGNRDSIVEGYGGAGIPIQSNDGILGVLLVQLEANREIADHVSLLTTLAEIAGNSIHRADLFGQSQEQVRRLTTLRDIDAAISSSTDLRVTMNILTDHTIKHLKADAVDIMLYHTELQSLTYLCSAGFTTPSPSRPLMRIGEGLAGQVVMKGGIEHIENMRETVQGKQDPLLVREGFISYFGVPLIVKGQIKGVFEIYHRSTFRPNEDWMQFMQTLAGQAAIAIDNSQLFDNLQRSNQELRQAYDTTLEGWAHALELRDRETEGHTRRVTELTIQLAHYMGISEDELENIYRGVLLHDIGKMGVPDNILRKTGPLTDTEWVEMRKHPQYAFDLLSPIPYLRPALDIPYCHHEHWDGSGYPRSLKGEQIPLSARLFSIVDIWDALLSDRPYRNAWPREKVIEYLKDVTGTILDPKIVDIFLKMIKEFESKTG